MRNLPDDLITFLFVNPLLLIIDKRHFSTLCKHYRKLTKDLLCEFEKGFKMNGFVFYEYGCIRRSRDEKFRYDSQLTLDNCKYKKSDMYIKWLENHIIEKESLEILSCGYFHLLTDKHINKKNSALMRGCAAFGNVTLLEKIKNIPKFKCDLDAVTTFAALNNQDDVITWVIENKLPIRYMAYTNAVNNRNFLMLKKLYENDTSVMRNRNIADVSVIAANTGQLEVLKWLHSIDLKFETYHILNAIKKNQLETLEWLISINCEMSIHAMKYAMAVGNLEIIDYLRGIC